MVNMKVLIFSDSHSSLRFMRKCMDIVRPDAVVHLGDHYDDAEALAEDFSHVPLYQVAGNCGRYRCPVHAREMLCLQLGGVMTYMTHGHNHRVKSGIGGLLADARRSGAQAVFYGHTHVPDCHREDDGLWVLNPGSAAHSAGVAEIDGGEITACYLLTEKDLEEML